MTSLAELEPLLRAAWDAETCDPVDLPWSPGNPSRGQCGVTALVLQDHLGGELLLAEVTYEGGGSQGFHYWNRLRDGIEVDLTRAQFAPHELVGEPRVVERPPGPPRRCREQYERLRERVCPPAVGGRDLSALPGGGGQRRSGADRCCWAWKR